MKKINIKKLLNMRLSIVVREAMEKGDLDLFNTVSWTRKYNGGMEDLQLEREVCALVEHFSYH